MTRYSASRGIIYSAPPGPSGERPVRTGAGASREGETSEETETGSETNQEGDDSESPPVEATADD